MDQNALWFDEIILKINSSLALCIDTFPYVYGSIFESLTFERPWLMGKSGMNITNSFAQPRSSVGQWNSPLIIPLKVLTQIQGTNVSRMSIKTIFVEKSEVLNLFNQDSRFEKAQFSPRYFASLKENAKSMLILIGWG